MLNISFFLATFSSISWLIYSLRIINFQSISAGNSDALFQNMMTVLFPIAVVWGIFYIIRNHLTEQKVFHCLYNSLNQVKKSTDAVQEIGQALADSERETRNSFLLQEFNLLISDINEILSDIIKRSNSVSSAQLEHLWTRTAGGERWIMAKTFIEIIDFQRDFSQHLYTKALKDSLLKGSILEFVSRYSTLKTLLKANNSIIFYNIIEYGAIGKVFEILTPMAEKLEKEVHSPEKTSATKKFSPIPIETSPSFSSSEENLEFPSFLSQEEDKTPTLSSPIIESEPKTSEEIDAGLRAIREEILSPYPANEEQKIKAPSTPTISSFTQTQMALRSIKNQYPEEPKKAERKTPVISLDELEREINASPENNYDEYAYPFGAWLDGKKHK